MILIYGGTGFIGSHFTKYLETKKIKFTVISKNKKLNSTNKNYFITSYSYENIRNLSCLT